MNVTSPGAVSDAELYRRHAPALVPFAAVLVGDDAEDVVASAFARCISAWPLPGTPLRLSRTSTCRSSSPRCSSSVVQRQCGRRFDVDMEAIFVDRDPETRPAWNGELVLIDL